MAKKIAGYIKLQIPAGKANPSPPVGPALGQRGLNIMQFCKDFNAQTQNMEPGMPVPVVISLAGIDWVNTGVKYGLQIVIPMAKFSKAPVARKVGDYLKQTISWTSAESTVGAGDDIKFILTNGSSAASL